MNERAEQKDLLDRIERLERAVFRNMPSPEPDGWVTNANADDEASLKLINSEYGDVVLGEPKATPYRTAQDLKADSIVGVYLKTVHHRV